MRTLIATSILAACALPVLAGDILGFRLAQCNPTNGWLKAQFDDQDIWLSPEPELTAAHVASAEFQWSRPALPPEAIAQLKELMPETPIDTNRHPQISIKFTEQGAALFAKVTHKNNRKRLAILSDATILAAPVIKESITGGVAVIEGKFTESEAKALAEELDKGSGTTAADKPPQPDPAILNQMQKAGASLMAIAEDSATNVLNSLKDEQIPPAVRTLENMAKGDRVKLTRHLAYYMKGASTNEVCGYQSVAIFAYFSFTTNEMATAIQDLEGVLPKGLAKELMWMARQVPSAKQAKTEDRLPRPPEP